MLHLTKIIVGILLTTVFMTPTPAKASWELIGGSSGKKMYIDPDTIEKTGDIAQYWLALSLDKPESGVSTIQIYQSMDCRKNILSTERMIGYDLKGNIMVDEKTSAIQPKVMAKFMYGFVCNQ